MAPEPMKLSEVVGDIPNNKGFLVRVLRLWIVPFRYNQNRIRCVEMLLMDEERVRVQATVEADLWDQFRDQVEEHGLYAMKNFRVEMNDVLFKPATHPYRLFLRLTKNMRLCNLSGDEHSDELQKFSEWILSIGNGELGGPNDGEAAIEIPDDLLAPHSSGSIKSIVDSTYPNFLTEGCSPSYLNGRAILAPTLEDVGMVNDYMVGLNMAEMKTYYSSDSTCRSDESGNDFLREIHSPEFLNGINCFGVPSHILRLKLGVPVMLMRNIDHSAGLCNGTRLIVTKLGDHVIEAKILNGVNAGKEFLIPRLSLTPSDMRLPFTFQRRQFPLVVCYAMTINKSQGQTLTNVGIYLRRPVFTHGQLYVAVLRVTNRKGLKFVISDDDDHPTKQTMNVVYKEVFSNL